MVVLRLFSLIFIVLALMLIGADGVSSLEKNGDLVLRSMAMILALVNADPSAWLQATLPASIAGALTTALSWPAWAIFGVIGVVFAAISTVGGRNH